MTRNLSALALFLLIFNFTELRAQSWPEELLLTPEKSNYERTSTYADVVTFLNSVTVSYKNVRLISMGKSLEGKDIPVAVLADPMIASAAEAKSSGKLIVYVQGNIHSGEVEGKEVVMMQIRDILFNERKDLLDNLIILFTPIYNTDSNDKMAYGRRPSQENSPPEVGIRENSQGLDLNRDGVKMEALETTGLLGIINEWDPQLFVDLHTTNGTWHGWNLTWAPSYHYAGEKAPYDFTISMLKDISKNVGKEYSLGFGPFGDYDLREGWPVKNFYTYNHHPRYLVNQFGLRNRMAVLSEAFAHEKFERRIFATEIFVSQILKYAASHASEIKAVNKRAEDATIALYSSKSGSKKGVKFKMVPNEILNDFPTYDYLKDSDQLKRQATKTTLQSINYYGGFEAEIESTIPNGYIIPAAFSDVVENLRKHGVKGDQLTRKRSYKGEYYQIEKYDLSQRKFEGHQMAKVMGKFVPANRKFKKGDFVVDLVQPLGTLAFYMLEPESDDGYVAWNFFDKSIEKQKQDNNPIRYPVFKYYNK